MAGFVNTVKVDLKYLNDVNDAEAGSNIASSVQPRFAGMLGDILEVTHAQAAQLSDTSIGTLFGGRYQYVKAGSALARGQIVAWDTLANNGLAAYQVTSTITLAMEGFLAGIALNTVTSGNYCFIQTWGLANVLYRAAVTSAVIGQVVTQLTTTNTADCIADATGSWIAGGALGLKNIIGTAYETPSNGLIKRVVLKNLHLNL